jgi:ArsR family transcriptional regulator
MDTKKLQLNKMKAQIIQAAGHPIRLAIIDFLSNGEKCVCDIVENVQAQRSNVSRHLSSMVKAGVLENRKDGLKMMYSIKTPCILKFLGCVEDAVKEQIKNQSELLKEFS